MSCVQRFGTSCQMVVTDECISALENRTETPLAYFSLTEVPHASLANHFPGDHKLKFFRVCCVYIVTGIACPFLLSKLDSKSLEFVS